MAQAAPFAIQRATDVPRALVLLRNGGNTLTKFQERIAEAERDAKDGSTNQDLSILGGFLRNLQTVQRKLTPPAVREAVADMRSIYMEVMDVLATKLPFLTAIAKDYLLYIAILDTRPERSAEILPEIKKLSVNLNADVAKVIGESLTNFETVAEKSMTTLSKFFGSEKMTIASENCKRLYDAYLATRNSLEVKTLEKNQYAASVRSLDQEKELLKSDLSDVKAQERAKRVLLDQLEQDIRQAEIDIVEHRNTYSSHTQIFLFVPISSSSTYVNNGEEQFRERRGSLMVRKAAVEGRNFDKAGVEARWNQVQSEAELQRAKYQSATLQVEHLQKDVADRLQEFVDAKTKYDEELNHLKVQHLDELKAIEDFSDLADKLRMTMKLSVLTLSGICLDFKVDEKIIKRAVLPAFKLLLLQNTVACIMGVAASKVLEPPLPEIIYDVADGKTCTEVLALEKVAVD